MAKAKAQSTATWSGSELVCAAVQQGKNTELCGDDHDPVTRGRMRAQYPLPHGRGWCNIGTPLRPPEFGYDTSSRAGEQEQDRGSKSKTHRARFRD